MLHWDGEMFPEIRGGRSMDRIAVLVIGYGHEKLLVNRGMTTNNVFSKFTSVSGKRLSPTCHCESQEHTTRRGGWQ